MTCEVKDLPELKMCLSLWSQAMFKHVLGVSCGSARFTISENPRAPGGTLVRLRRTGKARKKGNPAHLLEIIGLLSPRMLLLSFRMRDPAGLEEKIKSPVLEPVWILKCEKQNLQSFGTHGQSFTVLSQSHLCRGWEGDRSGSWLLSCMFKLQFEM